MSLNFSTGTFAVACLMTGRVVNQYSNHPNSIDESGTNHSSSLDSTGQIPEGPSPIEVATAVTFMVGMIQVQFHFVRKFNLSKRRKILKCIQKDFSFVFSLKVVLIKVFWFQLVMYIFQLGVISSLLSEPFVNGFTTGAAVHVLVSQINDLFGLKLPKQRGHFKVIRVSNWKSNVFQLKKYPPKIKFISISSFVLHFCSQTIIAVFSEIANTNIAALIVSIVTILIMICNNETLKVRTNEIKFIILN